MNEYKFKLVVKTEGSRNRAEMAVIAAFAKRAPDGCEFHLQPKNKRAIVNRLHKVCRLCGASQLSPCVSVKGPTKGKVLTGFHLQR
jgi:hypothetical protein